MFELGRYGSEYICTGHKAKSGWACMSDLDSEIREPFYGFEPQYRLRSRTQQSDPPVRPRIFRPSPRCLPNDARKFKPEFVIIPSKASTKA
ncbi:hypothetical protein OUZ56_005983 [Daphnia magna]|uniref:Uncharacterized protein n=1 Tax=Daphnia magna TaxID=35525 RepID=A0ABQ9YUH9_9CRUS|nr:hypothetical protein OUZ56_005983 [Daphnia magna]